MQSNPTVVRAADLAAYAPANHTGTSNVRVICPETVGATALEVLIGTIVKSHGAKPHAHPHLEQCAYMIEGTGESQAEGRVEAMGPGTWSYVPAGAFHSFRVTSDQPGRRAGRLMRRLTARTRRRRSREPDPAVSAARQSPRAGRRRGHRSHRCPHRPRHRRRAVGRDRGPSHGRRQRAVVRREAGRRAGALPRRRTHRCARRRAGLPSRARRLPVSPTRGRRGPALPDGPAGVRLPHQGTASVLALHSEKEPP